MMSRPLFTTLALLVATSSASAAETLTASSANSLDYFVGHWQCNGVILAGGKPIASTLVFERDTASGALLKHHDDLPPHRYHALELWGFATGGGFSDTIADSVGGARPPFSSTGWIGNTLTCVRKRPVRSKNGRLPSHPLQ